MGGMDIDAAYLAGFFDGEGCVRLNKRIRRGKYIEYAPFITLGQKDGKVLDWVKERFGGSVYRVKHDGSYMWTATHKTARDILRRIFPYLKYKRPQVELLLQFYDNIVQGSFMTPDEIERRELIMSGLKELKRVFAPSSYVSNGSTNND